MSDQDTPQRMSDRSKNLLVGAVAIAAMLCLGGLMLMFGYVPKFLEQGYTVTVQLPDAGGLFEGSRAEYGGVDVGYVQTITRVEPLRPAVEVVVKMKEDEVLPEHAGAYVSQPLIGGSNRLVFDLKDGVDPGAALPRDGSGRVIGASVAPFEALTEGLTGEDGPLGQLMAAMDDFEALASTWTAVGENLNAITEARSLADVDAGVVEANLVTTIARAEARLVELEATIGAMNEIVNGETFVEDIHATAANARAASERLDTTLDRADETLVSMDARFAASLDELTQRYVALGDELSETVASMQGAVAQAESGDGTMGRLMQDPALYENLNDAAARMRLMMDELQATLESIAEDGVRVNL